MGFTFKENCPDIRNTRVIDVVQELKSYGSNVDVYDPWVDEHEAQEEYGIPVISEPMKNHYDAIILAVAHREFRGLGIEVIKSYGKKTCVLYDLKSIFPAEQSELRL